MNHFRFPHPVYAPDDATGNSGGNGSAPSSAPTPGTNGPAAPDWAAFSRSMDKMRDDVVSAVGGLHQTVVDNTQREPEAEPVDLESLSREDLVAYTVGQVMSAMEEKLGEQLSPIIGAVNEMRTGNVTQTVTQDIEKLRADPAKEFDSWKGDMAELAKAHPTLGINDLYALAIGKNPDKVKQLADKRNPPKERNRWGGLSPNGTGRFANSDSGEKLTGRAATEAALTEVMERHPALEALLAS